MADQITITPELPPEDPNYVAEMAAKGEAAVNAGNTHNEQPAVAPKPDYVPEKFYNAKTGEVDYQALAKSYAELEKQRGSQSQAPKQDQTPPQQPPKENDEAPPQDAANEAVQKAGLDMADLQREYAEQGQLTDESYEALEKAGIPKETVDAYIAGQQALVEQAKTQAYTITGGEDAYAAMVDWAKANLSAEEIKSFNKQVNTMNAGVREIAIRGLHARFIADVGSDRTLAAGKSSSAGSTVGYASRQQLMEDMNNPKYKSDPAFRQQVIDKLAVSSVF